MATNASPKEAVLIVIAGPAGSGKSTLCERLVAEDPSFSRVVTATTRAPREGEVNGVHYHFLTAAAFDEKIAAGEFLEWAWVHRTNRYGTLVRAVLDPLSQGHSLVINIDVQGVDSFRRAAQANPELARRMVTVFIDVPIPVLRERLAARATDSLEEVNRRMVTAEAEYSHKHLFDRLIDSADKDSDFAGLKRIVDEARLKASQA